MKILILLTLSCFALGANEVTWNDQATGDIFLPSKNPMTYLESQRFCAKISASKHKKFEVAKMYDLSKVLTNVCTPTAQIIDLGLNSDDIQKFGISYTSFWLAGYAPEKEIKTAWTIDLAAQAIRKNICGIENPIGHKGMLNTISKEDVARVMCVHHVHP